jgi:beta-xylosidase
MSGDRFASRHRLAVAAWVVAAVLAAAGCSGDQSNGGSPRASSVGSTPGVASSSAASPASPASPASSPSASAATSSTAPSASVPADSFVNPVLDENFPDPFILRAGDTWYAYATGNLTWNIQVSTSADLVDWSPTEEALPKLPLWQSVSKGLTWAPEVIHTDAGYVMHFTTRDVEAGKQCLSVAVADDPGGPFEDTSTEPLECQLPLGGSIDSSPFTDRGGKRWLVWKNDGNCCGMRTRFFIAPLDPGGTRLTGKPRDLGLENDTVWEAGVIEAPQILLHDGTYYLFYSANNYASSRYAVGYATAKDVTGPYRDAKENPILTSKGDAAGPGHETIVRTDDGELWMAYHAWDPAQIGDNLGGRRAMWIDPLTFEDGKPVVHGPDEDPQPLP